MNEENTTAFGVYHRWHFSCGKRGRKHEIAVTIRTKPLGPASRYFRKILIHLPSGQEGHGPLYPLALENLEVLAPPM